MPLPDNFLRGRGYSNFEDNAGFTARKPVEPMPSLGNPIKDPAWGPDAQAMPRGGLGKPQTKPAKLPSQGVTPVPKAPIPNPIMSRKDRVARNNARNEARAQALRQKSMPQNQMGGAPGQNAGQLINQVGPQMQQPEPMGIEQFPGSPLDAGLQGGPNAGFTNPIGSQPPPWADLMGQMNPQQQAQIQRLLQQQQIQQAPQAYPAAVANPNAMTTF